MSQLVSEREIPWAGVTYSDPVQLDISSIERNIVDYLKGMGAKYGGPLSEVYIDHFPDRPEAYRLVSGPGAILVTFGGSEFAPARKAVDEVMGERVLRWDFAVIARDLGWASGGQPSGFSPGAYGILESLRLALSGYKILGCTKLAPVHERFTKRDEGIWHYESRFEHSTRVVQVEPDMLYDRWVRTTWMERGGQTDESVGPVSYTFDVNGQIHLPPGNIFSLVLSNPSTGDTYAATDYALHEPDGIITAGPAGPLVPGLTVDVTYRTGDVVHVTN